MVKGKAGDQAQCASSGQRLRRTPSNKRLQPICSAALRKRLNRAVSRLASLSNAPFGTHHHTGCDRMKQAIWKVAPFGDFAFRASRSGQLPLHMVFQARASG